MFGLLFLLLWFACVRAVPPAPPINAVIWEQDNTLSLRTSPQFVSGSADLLPESEQDIHALADFILADDSVGMVVIVPPGPQMDTDNFGRAYGLSYARAGTIMMTLLDAGVPPERVGVPGIRCCADCGPPPPEQFTFYVHLAENMSSVYRPGDED